MQCTAACPPRYGHGDIFLGFSKFFHHVLYKFTLKCVGAAGAGDFLT